MDGDATLWATLVASSFTFWGIMAATAKLAVYLSSFLAAGLMLFLLALPLNNAQLRNSLLQVAGAASVLAVLASLWRVMVQAGRLMDDVAFMIDPEIIAISLDGPLGTSSTVRLVGLTVLLVAILLPTLRFSGSLVGSFLVAMSFALTGHAIRDPQWALAGLVTIHLLAVSFWFGALLPLYRLTSERQDHDEAARLSHRFGQQASLVVPVLIAVGGVFAYLLLGSVQAFYGTAYGQMLLVKLVLVALVLGIAALNKLRLVPAPQAGEINAAARFRSSLRWEALVFLGIFGATALLTTSITVPTH